MASRARSAATPALSPPAVEQAVRLSREGRREDALRSLDESLKRHPADPQLRFLYGVVLAELQRGEDAIGVFEQLTRISPSCPSPTTTSR